MSRAFICKTCEEHWRHCSNGIKEILETTLITITFCVVNIINVNRNNNDKWTYPNLLSVSRPVPYLDLILVLTFHELPQLSKNVNSINDIKIVSHSKLFNKNNLSDLIRDLNLLNEPSV